MRLALGAVLVAGGAALLARGDGAAWTVTVVGVLVLASGVLGFCPPYLLLGISTARKAAPLASREPESGAR